MKSLKITTLDRYIIRQFLGTYIFAIAMILVISIVFDVAEKIDDFLADDVSLHDIIFDYYLNFIPYFANLFSPIFVFISVIFFTSKMAGRSEIIAILASGISFRRLLYPYILTATIIFAVSVYLSNFIIPNANDKRLKFEAAYIRTPGYSPNGLQRHRRKHPKQPTTIEILGQLPRMGQRKAGLDCQPVVFPRPTPSA
mgnify:CR=1 FL=1